ncbi:MAG: cell division protein CrgA [Nocardioidaceae bacterium]|nr:cell division protein CrgA [Nocardioidaceae bacterium]MCL2614276.1 cell division protein CrgA [Nocardioidaceae bacterium]
MAKPSRLPKLRKGPNPFADPDAGPVLSVRFIIALVLIAVGIAWICYTYWGVRPSGGWGATDLKTSKPEATGGPSFMGNLENWNYLIGFVVLFLGLVVSAHPKTPLGRGRGVVTGMLGCFVLGLLWICCYYIFLTGNDPKNVPIFNDLGQKNLFVGIAFMAVGFTFATRWE